MGNAKIREFNPTTESETLSTLRKTGWFSISQDLSRSAFVRRINARYKSGDDITVKVYVDGDSTNPVKTVTLRANDGSTGLTTTVVGWNSATDTILMTASVGSLKSGDWIKADSEIMKIVDVGDTAPAFHRVQRGMRGTTAAIHNSGVTIHYANYPYDSFKIGRRAKYMAVEVSSSTSSNDIEINKMEIEHEYNA
tara:strand:+ start:12254 stop:12838 length:585 start_codon:yes stop_codon:yes gene_type:complete